MTSIEHFVEDVEQKDIDFASDTLKGDVRDQLLELFKHRPMAWEQMSEGQQADLGRTLDHFAGRLVQEACEIIGASGRRVVSATVKKVSISDKIQVTLEAPNQLDSIVMLGEAAGKVLQVVVNESAQHMGAKGEVDVDPDEPSLLDEGGEDPADDGDDDGEDPDGADGAGGAEPADDDGDAPEAPQSDETDAGAEPAGEDDDGSGERQDRTSELASNNGAMESVFKE